MSAIKDGGNKDEEWGRDIVLEALKAPFNTIMSNAGLDGNVIWQGLGKKDGFDARLGEPCNMIESGIIDPTKVTRLALENAVSVAGTMLITEAVVSIDRTVDSKTPVDPAQQMLLG